MMERSLSSPGLDDDDVDDESGVDSVEMPSAALSAGGAAAPTLSSASAERRRGA